MRKKPENHRAKIRATCEYCGHEESVEKDENKKAFFECHLFAL